jgi:hypothetical protein
VEPVTALRQEGRIDVERVRHRRVGAQWSPVEEEGDGDDAA